MLASQRDTWKAFVARHAADHRSRSCLTGPTPSARRGLAVAARCSPAREREIVDELSQHLDDRYERAARAGDARRGRARGWRSRSCASPTRSRAQMRPLRQAHVPPPIAAGRAARRLARRPLAGSALRGAHAAQAAGLRRRRRADAGARHRRQHRDLQPRQRHAAAAPAGRRTAIGSSTCIAAASAASSRTRCTRRCATATSVFDGLAGLGRHHRQPQRRRRRPSSSAASSSPATSSTCSASAPAHGRLLVGLRTT